MESRISNESCRDSALLVSESEAAKMLGISPRTLWSIRNTGEISCVRIGRSVRYSVASLQQWIRDREGGR